MHNFTIKWYDICPSNFNCFLCTFANYCTLDLDFNYPSLLPLHQFLLLLLFHISSHFLYIFLPCRPIINKAYAIARGVGPIPNDELGKMNQSSKMKWLIMKAVIKLKWGTKFFMMINLPFNSWNFNLKDSHS